MLFYSYKHQLNLTFTIINTPLSQVMDPYYMSWINTSNHVSYLDVHHATIGHRFLLCCTNKFYSNRLIEDIIWNFPFAQLFNFHLIRPLFSVLHRGIICWQYMFVQRPNDLIISENPQNEDHPANKPNRARVVDTPGYTQMIVKRLKEERENDIGGYYHIARYGTF